MSHQSTHDHLLLNSIPQIHHHQHPNHIPLINYENDSDDDLVFLPNIPKIPHTFEEYDPECQCSTCQLVRKLLAECTCEECKVTEQPDQSSENVPIANAVSPTNGQPSSSSIQNNDASTSEHTNANDQHDDHSRSSTPDYLPRFFDDESRDSSSDDCEDDDSVDDGDDLCDIMEVDKESLNSNSHSQPSTSCRNAIVTNVDKSNLIDNGSTNSDDEGTDLTPDKCLKCAKTFSDIHKLLLHYRGVHQELNPNYCRWLSEMKLAREQVLKEPLQGRLVNSARLIEHLIKVDPDLSSSNRLQKNDAFTSDLHTNANYLDDVRERSSPPDCMPRLFDDESKDSPSDDSENDVNHNMEINTYDDEDYVKSESEENNDPDYTFRDSSSDDSEDDDSVDDNHPVDSGVDQQSDPEYVLPRSITNKSLTKCKRFTKHIKTNDVASLVTYHQATDDECNSSEIEPDENENDFDNDKSQIHSASYQDKSFVCPKCESSFDEKWKLLRHYRAVHLEWKPFYCKWPKCDFVHGVHDNVARHVSRKHLNMKNRRKERKYVGKREWSSSSQEDPIYESILGNTSFNSNCPNCGRKFTHVGHLRRHLGSHKKSGFRCTWLQCGFFFSDYNSVRQHILKEHFNGKMVNSTQISEHLIKVDPKLSNYNELQNNDASTSELTNANDLDDDDHSRSSTPDYLPRFFDDENGDSSSDDSEDDDSVYDGDEEDHKTHDQENESDDANDSAMMHSDVDYAFSKPSTSKSLKRSHSKSSSISPANSFVCPKCESSFDERNKLLKHYRRVHHEWKPYYCKWSRCEFVAGIFDAVVLHANRKHFNSENRKKARIYVGMQQTSSSPPKDPIYESLLRNTRYNSKCPKCGRNFKVGRNFKLHLGTHDKSGFRCTWRQCGFFFSNKKYARKHLRKEHFIGKGMNLTQIDEHLVEVDPKTSKIASRATIKTTNRISTYDEQNSNDDESGEGEKFTRSN